MHRRTLSAILVATATIGVQVLVPLVWPQLNRGVGLALLAVCCVGLLGAALIFPWTPHAKRSEPTRRWQLVGMGQGWLEARVRNNAGDELMVSWNGGAGNDRISVWATFSTRRAARKADNVELIFDVDGTTYEWDVSDNGGDRLAITGETWRTVEALRQMLTAMREGDELIVSAPTLDLRSQFTLLDAFDVLEEAVSVGTQGGGPAAGI